VLLPLPGSALLLLVLPPPDADGAGREGLEGAVT
jgi:hypothetical protein